MFKGKILQFNDTEAIVLSDTLNYEKIKLKAQMEIGQDIFYFEEDLIVSNDVVLKPSILDRFSSIKFAYGLAPVIAVLLIAIMLFNEQDISTPLQLNYYGVISIDINPSISLLVNEDGVIEHAEGKNEDGIKLLSTLTLLGESIYTGLDTIIEASEISGYLTEDKHIFIATTEQSAEHHIDDLVSSALESLESDDNYTIYLADLDYDVYKESETENVSLGHYFLDSKTDVKDEVLFSPETINNIERENDTPEIKKRNSNKNTVEETSDEQIIQDKQDDNAEDNIDKKEAIQDKQDDKAEDKIDKKDAIQDKQDDKAEDNIDKKDAIQDKQDDNAEDNIDKKDAIQDKQDDKAEDNIDKKEAIQDKQSNKAENSNKETETGKNSDSRNEKSSTNKDSATDKTKNNSKDKK